MHVGMHVRSKVACSRTSAWRSDQRFRSKPSTNLGPISHALRGYEK
jgi:hypothetical protein